MERVRRWRPQRRPHDFVLRNAKREAGDFDGDGDIALTSTADWNTIPIAFNQQDGSHYYGTNQGATGFTAFPVAAGQAGAQVVAADFDGDGKDDLALTAGTGWNTVPLAISNGDGTFRATNLGMRTGDLQFASEAQTANVHAVAGDFNHDGRTDFAAARGVGWTTVPTSFSNPYPSQQSCTFTTDNGYVTNDDVFKFTSRARLDVDGRRVASLERARPLCGGRRAVLWRSRITL